jgi:hypothetical protein
VDRFTFLQDKTAATISFSQTGSSSVIEYPLVLLNANSTPSSLCALLNNRVSVFSAQANVTLSVAFNGKDYEVFMHTRLNITNPKVSLVFYDGSVNGE